MITFNRICSYFSDQPSHYFTAHDTAFVGLCTGLLSASAVSSSQSTLDLIDKSLTTVRVAFRIGVKVSGVAQRLTSNGEANDSQSWSRLVLGAQKEPSISAVEDFNNKQVKRIVFRPLTKRMLSKIVTGHATSYPDLRKRV